MFEINCHNNLKLGDCIQTLHFLINAVDINDIRFNFACKAEYHDQLLELIC